MFFWAGFLKDDRQAEPFKTLMVQDGTDRTEKGARTLFRKKREQRCEEPPRGQGWCGGGA